MENENGFNVYSLHLQEEIWPSKIGTLVILLVSTLLFGLIPIFVIRKFRQGGVDVGLNQKLERGLSLLNCFAGGVFFGTTLLHLLPEANEGIENFLKDAGIKTNFALSEFVIAFGFFLVMFIEHAVMICKTARPRRELQHQVHHDDHPPGETAGIFGNAAHNQNYGSIPPREGNAQQQYPTGNVQRAIADWEAHGIVREANHQRGGPEAAQEHHHHHHHEHHVDPKDLASLRSFTLLLALSFHTLFEGLAIGLEPTRSGVWDLFIAIVVHKSVIAFSMGIQFAESLKTYGRAVVFIILFAIMSPIGIAIGTSIFASQGQNGSVEGITSAVLQAIAAGTFLYVTFFEVLSSELSHDHCLLKVFVAIVGFGIMTLLNLFNGEPADG